MFIVITCLSIIIGCLIFEVIKLKLTLIEKERELSRKKQKIKDLIKSQR